MGGRVNWDWPLGNLDIPININNVNQNSDNLFVNIGILSDIEDLHTGQFINILVSEETDTPFNDNLDNNSSDLFESTPCIIITVCGFLFFINHPDNLILSSVINISSVYLRPTEEGFISGTFLVAFIAIVVM